MKTQFLDAVNCKRTLVDQIARQMKNDVNEDILKKSTLEMFELVKLNLDASELNLTNGKYAEAFQYFSRACVHLGQFNILQKLDRKLV